MKVALATFLHGYPAIAFPCKAPGLAAAPVMERFGSDTAAMAVMNCSAGWLHQAQADPEQARISPELGCHEWACFASH